MTTNSTTVADDGARLEPCPFCGDSDVEIWSPDDGFSEVLCQTVGCGARSGDFTDVEKVVQQWNTRANQYDALKQENEALRNALKLMMQWIGPPPVDRMSYDSLREDAWKAARAALKGDG